MTSALSSGAKGSVVEDRRIAIVGMSCLFPQSFDLASFWQNIVDGNDCLREVGPGEWSQETFYQPFAEWRKEELFERIYCKRGGFITETAEFNALKYGVMPKAVAGTDPDQMLALKLACQAIADAGYDRRTFDAEKAEVIIGRTSAPGHGAMNAIQYGATVEQVLKIVAAVRPDWNREELNQLAAELRQSLTPCEPEAIPGVMPNILAGRIAGKLGFRGKSLILDAACASSLIAVEMAVNDLRAGLADLVLAGGSFVNSFAVFYQLFCRLGALSHSEQIKPFDQAADGTLLGEGIGMVVLKRLSDAIKDGDRIYASIVGVGSSSDAKGTSMLAPAVEGEALALKRAYLDADVSPRTIELMEAHGTATAVGDVAEMQALQKVFGVGAKNDQDSNWCALGSIKSMIGHCQAASGVAGLIKAALSLYQRVLPPTLNVTQPNKQIDWQQSPCYINAKTRPWIHAKPHPILKATDPSVVDDLPPRRAGVSAFGFGGVNAHAVLEEYEDPEEGERASLHQDWETEVFCFVERERAALAEKLGVLQSYLQSTSADKLKDLAFSVNSALGREDAQLDSQSKDQRQARQSDDKKRVRLALVCRSAEDLKSKLKLVRTALLSNEPFNQAITAPELRGIYLSDSSDISDGKLAFILPGLGAAYPGMLAELCLHFPEVRMIFDFVDYLAAQSGDANSPSQKIFPPLSFNGKGSGESSATLAAMDAAVVTVLMAEWAMFTLLFNLEIVPDILVGCSTGEFAALTMSGSADILTASSVFYHLSTSTARSIPQDKLAELRSLRVAAPFAVVEPYLKERSDSVYLGADLSESQVLLSGYQDSIEELIKQFDRDGIQADLLPSAVPYHTPLVQGLIDADRQELLELEMNAPQIPSWSCSTGSYYPDDVDALKSITTRLFSVPILFRQSIEALYNEGVRKFVEVGPKGTLSTIVSEILEDKPHLSVASNRASISATTQLNHMLAALFAQGVSMNLAYLYKRREPKLVEFIEKNQASKKAGSELLKLSYPELRLLEGWQERTGLRSDHQLIIESAVGPAMTGEVEEETDLQAEDELVPGQETVVRSYLDTVSSFHQKLMSLQEEVMTSYLNSYNGQDEEQCVETGELSERKFPLLRGAQFHAREDGLAVEFDLNLTDHCYLIDHAIGGIVRTIHQIQERVFLLPLTVALELMAEAASYLYPGLPVSMVSDVRAYKRIRVGAEGVKVEIIAKEVPEQPGAVNVEIGRRRNQPEDSNGEWELLMTCRITFVEELTKSNSNVEPDRIKGRAPQLDPLALYGPGAMFHGQRMQAVRSLTVVAEREISGQVSAKRPEGWFGEAGFDVAETGDFLLHPLLLDNATQLVLFHLYEHKEEADALLPFIVESVRFYDDLNAVSESLTVRAVLDVITQRNTSADVQILDDQGQLVAEFCGISSRRIVLDERWRRFVNHPEATFLSEEQHLDFAGLLGNNALALRAVRDSILPDDEGTLAWCADYLLSPAETQIFENLSGASRRREWLLGRIAAKDAVRELAMKTLGKKFCPADIEIYADEQGRPFIADLVLDERKLAAHVSITHKNGTAIAIAIEAQDVGGIGIDLELVQQRESGFEALVLNQSELKRFRGALGEERDLSLAKIWSVKEAAGKAVGTGLSSNPKSFEIVRTNNSLDEFEVVASRPILALAGGREGTGDETTKPAFSSAARVICVACLTLDQSVLAIALCGS